MSNIEEQIIELQKEWENDIKEYNKKTQEIYNSALFFSNRFNSQITIVNVERHLMRREMYSLYKFLKHFGNVGKSLTPFDFVAEDWLFPNNGTKLDIYSDLNIVNGKNNFDIDKCDSLSYATYATTGIGLTTIATRTAGMGLSSLAMGTIGSMAGLGMFAPISIPAYMIFSKFKQNQKAKEKYENLVKQKNTDKIERENDIQKQKVEVTFLMQAVQIADLYRSLIASIRDIISDKIIPELSGILAFLYADAIKNCIINNEDPGNARIGNISEYIGTPYEAHYQFIKNTFDYYVLISKFFTEPVLTKLLKEKSISESELDTYVKRIQEIENQRQKLIEGCLIGGEI